MDPLEPFIREIETSILHILRETGIDGAFTLEVPPNEIADFALPCFHFARTMKKAPTIVAEEIRSKLPDMDLISKIWVAGGYVNFQLKYDTLARLTLQTIISERDNYGSFPRKNFRILLEHTSVNPTGPIHVGRARNPLIGDTLARCLRMGGYDVQTEYYVNDVGKQVILLVWGVENIPEEDINKGDREKADHRLVAFYQKANELMENDPRISAEISEMLRRFEMGDEAIVRRVREITQQILDGISQSLKEVNVEIDNFVWESQFILDGSAKQIVKKLKETKFAREEEGAYYLDLEEYGIEGRDSKFFFTRSDGTTLYTTRDLAYHLDKFKRADHVINILGEDQKLGMAHLEAALRILGINEAPENVFYSFVSLPEGRMSTRKGRVVTLDDLIDEAEERALEEVKKRRTDLSESKMVEIAREIGLGAIRYNIIRIQAEKPIVFKWHEALNFEGNSAPFVQYAHARACSILKKAGHYDHVIDPLLLSDQYEIRLIKVLARFPSVIKEAGEKRRIHLLPAYGHELASAFNQFYTYVPVLKGGERINARLTLVESTMWTLRNCLNVMGIGSPEEM